MRHLIFSLCRATIQDTGHTELSIVDTFPCDLEDALGDLLADLMHWAEANDECFETNLDRARGHYEAELCE